MNHDARIHNLTRERDDALAEVVKLRSMINVDTEALERLSREIVRLRNIEAEHAKLNGQLRQLLSSLLAA